MNKEKTSIRVLGRWLIIIMILTATNGATAQWWQEDFGASAGCANIDSLRSYTTANGQWEITYPTGGVNDSIGSYWFVSNREAFTGLGNCGDGCLVTPSLSENTLHISTNNTGIVDQGAVYEADSISDMIAWSPAINTTGANQLLLTFNYLEGGGNTDNGTIVIGVGGTNAPVTIFDPAKTTGGCGVDGEWSQAEVLIDSSYNNLFDIRIGFRWESNGDSVGTLPSFAIDSIVIIDTVPPTEFVKSVDTICAGDAVNFTNLTPGSNNSYFWQFPGSNTITSTAKSPQNIVYPNPGMFYITLTTTNPNGSSMFVDSIYVDSCVPPVPDFDASLFNICVGQCIDFTDESLPGTFGLGQWQWQFQGGSPNTSTAQNPANICYTTPGTYDITMTVTDTVTGLSAVDTFENAVTVGNCFVPTASFTSDTNRVCNNDYIEFYALTTGDPDSITWIFEGGNPASITDSADALDTISVFYPTPGTYDVTIVVWNPAGQGSDTLRDYVTIDNCPSPTALIEANRTTICPREEVVFVDNSIAARSWYWEFPGGSPSSSNDQVPPPITYETPGTYPVILIVTNVNGVDTLIAEDYITVDSCKVPEPRYELERDSICRGTCLQIFNTSKYLDITDTTDSFAFILWYHPYTDSVTGTAADTISALTPGYEWMADDSNLIAFNDTFFVIHEDYFPVMAPIWNQNDPILCFDDSATIGIQMFAYNQHGPGVLNEQDEAVINIGGAYPELNPGPDKELIIDNRESRFFLEDTTSFDTRGTAPFWRWVPEEGLSCYDCPRPVIYPTETKKYFVTNYDEYGCQAYDSVIVYVEQAYFAGIPNIFSPNGDDNNDILWVRGNGISSDGFIMRIWDRYGAVVFESYSQNDGWDGTYKGAPAPAGSYKYYVKFIFDNGTIEELTGNVTLVRY
ncbi:MAG: PKD domain-containing protein [Salibacteraceae bacterium]